MKGNISLGRFIAQVKDELKSSQSDPADAFYELTDVQLEVTFALSTKGGAKGKLVVVELGGETAASQTHKVILNLKPLPLYGEREGEDGNSDAGGGGGDNSGGGGGTIPGGVYSDKRPNLPLYAPANIKEYDLSQQQWLPR
ncbi:trypco2 family protein [Halomonas organivorans]|uniref:Putative membrane protein YgcG n=1 Tax=Halomonas organivorans TaxID=257772 RepID=A0A7W5G5K7_9GAMM|nr:trypco2 family protein [Halomonas organivorans]MBB3141229.1 putative membrane protein YgcG [Halomonas organivorans]